MREKHFHTDSKRRGRSCKPCARAATWFMLLVGLFRNLLRHLSLLSTWRAYLCDQDCKREFHQANHWTANTKTKRNPHDIQINKKTTRARAYECGSVATAARKNYSTAIPKKKSPLSPSETAADCPSSPPQQPLDSGPC